MARRPRQRARPPWLVAAALAASAGCGFDADYTGATVTCAEVDPRCPDGYQCVAGTCRTTAPPAIDAAGPDASVCELAAQQPDNDRCAAAIDVAVAATEVERYGDTAGYANDLAPSVLPGCTGSPEPGPDAVYRLALTAGDTLHAELRTTGHDGAIYLLDGEWAEAGMAAAAAVPVFGDGFAAGRKVAKAVRVAEELKETKTLRKVGRDVIERLKKMGEHPHDLKKGAGGARSDVYVDREGNLYTGNKDGSGFAESLSITIEELFE